MEKRNPAVPKREETAMSKREENAMSKREETAIPGEGKLPCAERKENAMPKREEKADMPKRKDEGSKKPASSRLNLPQ